MREHFIIEGIDRLGKSLLIENLQHRLGFRQVIHYGVPPVLRCYKTGGRTDSEAQLLFQETSFRSMFRMLAECRSTGLIFDRGHLGEYVYALRYRNYPGDYVFALEEEFGVRYWDGVRLVLLVEEFSVSRHFADDDKGLGPPEAREGEQASFQEALGRSIFPRKKEVCVTDLKTGKFRDADSILEEVLA